MTTTRMRHRTGGRDGARRGLRRLRRLANALAVIALALTACAPAPTGSPAPTATIAPSSPPSSASATATPTDGSIVVLACGPAASAPRICLGDGDVSSGAGKPGSTIELRLTVSNPRGGPSTPVSLLISAEGGAALPFGSPVCQTCNSTSSKSVIGLEWPALAGGEQRTLTVGLPITAAAGTVAWAANLYAQPLADVIATQIVSGIPPSQHTWKGTVLVTP